MSSSLLGVDEDADGWTRANSVSVVTVRRVAVPEDRGVVSNVIVAGRILHEATFRPHRVVLCHTDTRLVHVLSIQQPTTATVVTHCGPVGLSISGVSIASDNYPFLYPPYLFPSYFSTLLAGRAIKRNRMRVSAFNAGYLACRTGSVLNLQPTFVHFSANEKRFQNTVNVKCLV